MGTSSGYETPQGLPAADSYRLSHPGAQGESTYLPNQRYHIGAPGLHLGLGPAPQDQSETLTRAFGCLLISLMPDAAVTDAIKSLVAAYEFAVEDETLVPIPEIVTYSTGIAVGSDEDTWE